MSPNAKPMAENLYRALWSWLICVGVTVLVSMVTKPVPTEQLSGLVYGVTPIPHDGSKTIWEKPIFWTVVVIIVFFILNLLFW
jgi:SSS family solute:Na+ symporter